MLSGKRNGSRLGRYTMMNYAELTYTFDADLATSMRNTTENSAVSIIPKA